MKKGKKTDEELAVLGGEPIRKRPFPPYPVIGEEEVAAVNEVVKSGNLSMFDADFLGGEKVRKFEEDFAKYHGREYAISVNSGTAALHVATAAANIGPGDEVIVPPYTFTSTATSVLMNNAIPVFVDVDPLTFNLDPGKVEDAITERTKAIIPVHLLGHPAEIDSIIEIAERRRLTVIEDCAQAPGALYKGKKVGTFGHLATFSFQKTKNMTTGEGGMILTSDSRLAHRCRLIRNHGEQFMEGQPREYLANILGWNYRMTEMEAAVGIEQLKKLDNFNEIRIRNANYLTKKLSEIEGINPPYCQPHAKHIFHIYATTYEREVINLPKDTLVWALEAEGIPVWAGHPRPLYENPIFKERIVYGERGCPFRCGFYNGGVEGSVEGSVAYEKGLCPVTEELCEKVIAFYLIRPPATTRDMQDIVAAFTKIIENKERLQEFRTINKD